VRLYIYRYSPQCRKVLATARLSGITFETVDVDLPSGQQRTQEFMNLNPNAKVPVLVDGDFILWESNAIMEYLVSKADPNALYPTSSKARADVSRWLFWQAAHLTPVVDKIVMERVVSSLHRLSPVSGIVLAIEPGGAAKAEKDLKPLLSILESVLSAHTFLVGNQLTLADLAIAATLLHAEDAGIDILSYPGVNRLRYAVGEIPEWQEAGPVYEVLPEATQ
jgi:glutathione S-transferase